MLVLESKAKKLLENVVQKDLNISLQEYFQKVYTLLKEDEEQLDFASLKDRIKWYLGKLVQNPEVLEQWQKNDLFKELFKDVVITVEDNKINLTIKGQEVVGNTKGIALVFIIYTYLFTTSFISIGESYKEVGGALIKRAAKTFSSEASKRADLSDYSITGEPIRALSESIIDNYPLSALLASAVVLVLIDNKFSKVHQSLLLLSISIIKTTFSNSIGYMYSFIVKLKDLFDINTEFLAKDILAQFKAIGIYIENE